MSALRFHASWGRTRLSGPVLPPSPATVFAGGSRCFGEPFTNFACASVSCFGFDLALLAFPQTGADQALLPALLNFLARVLVLVLGSWSREPWRRSVLSTVVLEAGYDGALDASVASLDTSLAALGATVPLSLQGLCAVIAALANSGGIGLAFIQAGADTITDAAARAVGRVSIRASCCIRAIVSALHKVGTSGLALASIRAGRIMRDVRRVALVRYVAAIRFPPLTVPLVIYIASAGMAAPVEHLQPPAGVWANRTRNLHRFTSGFPFDWCGGLDVRPTAPRCVLSPRITILNRAF